MVDDSSYIDENDSQEETKGNTKDNVRTKKEVIKRSDLPSNYIDPN